MLEDIFLPVRFSFFFIFLFYYQNLASLKRFILIPSVIFFIYDNGNMFCNREKNNGTQTFPFLFRFPGMIVVVVFVETSNFLCDYLRLILALKLI